MNWKHLREGVAKCLLGTCFRPVAQRLPGWGHADSGIIDRILTRLNYNHHHRQGVDYVGEEPLTRREVKTIVIEVPFWDNTEEENAITVTVRNDKTGATEKVPGWKTKLLESLRFEHVATLPGVGGIKQANREASTS